ncbi:fatty acid desaturase family protein [uncultured Jatrophihabitans sp.]|uniref:fatty acid desaturase family protein n=1 Tax=uncultured Jatrophihabitans sp. TaxID=1610747 RepID=UPI0035CA33A0
MTTTVEPPGVPVGEIRRGSDYAGLSRAIRAARLLERTPWRYAVRTALTLGFFAACWVLVAELGASWFVLVAAGLLGIASTQIAFLGHDGGHQQIAAKRSGNTVAGLLAGDLLSGLSIGWWVDKHNRHHANPNKEDHDPDIGEGVLAFTAAAAAGRTGWLARATTRNQAFLFFPLLLLEGIQLHAAGIQYLCSRGKHRLGRTEATLLTVHFAAYLGASFTLLPPLHAVAFIAVHQAVFGFYMGCSFAPNHKGMPVIPADQTVDYLRRQVLTSRNVRGGWFTDQLFGGLNYQIEHHLFPSMPRAHLRRAQQLTREYCATHDITYTQTGMFASYRMALSYLHELGAPLRAARRAATPAVTT